MSNDASLPAITKEMTVREVITLFPKAAEIMALYDIHCFSCAIGGMETLEEGCKLHGFDDETTQELLEDINDALSETPPRPSSLEVTKEAAEQIFVIMQNEKRDGEGLAVIVDADGSFCMEFQKDADAFDQTFSHPDVSTVRLFASPITLSRIGGATIDFRDGRFKLDLPEDSACAHDACHCKGTESDCKK